MKQKIVAYIKSIPWYTWILLIIIGLGIFLRVYHFQDWLFMKGDQARDSIMTSNTYRVGLSGLPLLGPRAGGTTLRLGPIFYYFQYISAILFHSASPDVFAYPTLFFSLLTIPILYIFLKKFFSANWSLLLTALFSSSYLMIDYSRFAWNPNAVPFFVILFFLALLKIFSRTKYPIWWTIAAAVSFSVSTQLHFSVFVGLPIILAIFLVLNAKDIKGAISWKQVIIFLSIILLFYVPVIASDILNKGDNLKQFISAVSSKSSDNPIVSDIAKVAYYSGKNFLFIAGGYMGSDETITWVAQLLILLAFILNVWLWKKEKDKGRANFLLIMLLNLIVYFLLFIPLSAETDNSRFFLPVAFMPFVFLGFLGIYANEKLRKYDLGKILFGLLIVIAFLYNFRSDYMWFDTMTRSQTQYVTRDNSIILQEKGNKLWWSWSHFKKIAAFMHNDCQERDIYFFTSKGVKDYADSVRFAFSNSYTDKNIYLLSQTVPEVKGCFYFVAQSYDDVDKEIKKNFVQDAVTDLGNVSMLRFSFPENIGNSLSVYDPVIDDNSNNNRQFWGDVWNALFNKK